MFNIAGNLVGIMPRGILHKLVLEKAFYKQESAILTKSILAVVEEEPTVENE